LHGNDIQKLALMTVLTKIIQDMSTLLQSNPILSGNLKYVILALLVAVEGPIATLLGAAAAASGFMQLKLVFIFAAFGNLCADSVWYSLGYAGKQAWLLKIGQRFGLTQKLLENLQAKIQKQAVKILFIAKVTNGFIIPSLITAGFAKVPWKRWFLPVAAGEMFWTGTLVLIGYYTTQTIQQIQKDIHIFAISSSVVILLLGLWLVRKWFLNKGNRFFSKLNNQNE
jgi:membrane protein DedA with SNARE-associated domain